MSPHHYDFTSDTDANSMIKQLYRIPEPAKYDRIIVHSQTRIPVQIEIVGNQSNTSQGHFSVRSFWPSGSLSKDQIKT